VLPAPGVSDTFTLLGSLPRFVCSNPDNMPSLRVDESDLKVIIRMVEKLSQRVSEMGLALAAMARDVSQLQVSASYLRSSRPTRRLKLRQSPLRASGSYVRRNVNKVNTQLGIPWIMKVEILWRLA